jgi:cytochrome c556
MRTFYLAILVFLALPAFAHDGAMGVVKERMDGMKAMNAAMKTLSGLSASGTPDPERVLSAAKTIQMHAGSAMLEKFPEGSLDDPTEVNPDVWKNWDEFSALAMALEGLANELAGACANGVVDVKTFRAITKNCKDCHADFRIRK